MSSTNMTGNMNRVPRAPLQRVISLMQFLESYGQDVTKLESALGDLKAKDAEIRKLDSTNKVLVNSRNEEIAALEREVSTLVAHRDEIDRREEAVRQNEARLARAEMQAVSEQEQAKQKMSKASERKISDAIAEHKKQTAQRMKKLEDDSKELIREKEKLASDLAAAQGELKKEKEESKVTFKRITKENHELERALKELEGRYPVHEEPLGS
jgi:type II secretory pathway component GspD/PulD (secretin)